MIGFDVIQSIRIYDSLLENKGLHQEFIKEFELKIDEMKVNENEDGDTTSGSDSNLEEEVLVKLLPS